MTETRERSVKTRIAIAAAVILAAAGTAGAQTYALKAPIAEKPAFVTTVGQSADIEMVKVLLDRSAVPYTANAQAKAGDLGGLRREDPDRGARRQHEGTGRGGDLRRCRDSTGRRRSWRRRRSSR